jgi:tetratricopeptide (TPR) repeat protein
LNTNQKALEFFNQNEYQKALKLFKRAVIESRDIQSLNNLAWMYLYEEENDEEAFKLIQEVILMNPNSYFPYNILGEIYIRQKEWKLASDAFNKSISIHPNNEALANIAAAKYHLGDFKEAAELFQRFAGDSDYTMYSHLKCLIKLDMKCEAKNKLDKFNPDADDYVGDVEVAELYVELKCFKEAINFFEKGWDQYSKDPSWICIFVYALYQLGNTTRIDQVLQEGISEKKKDIKEAYEEELEENWTEDDKNNCIKQLIDEKNKYENMLELFSVGNTPIIDFEPSITGGCYLFGCKLHKHAEYQ